MNVTIFGASGGVGRELVEQAVARGHRVRAVVRRPAWVPCGAKPVLVDDVTDPARVAEVTRGADAVLSALGLRRRSRRNPWSPLASPPDLCARWARAMVSGCGRGAGRSCSAPPASATAGRG
jgi:NAD(P)-dependent dehydrogenase (short-subunit alcohol dehydrogenase family)